MVRRVLLSVAFATALVACGGGKKGGGGGGGGDHLNPGPASGGGGVSTRVGSLRAQGGASGAGGLPGRGGDGGQLEIVSWAEGELVVDPAPGLPAKPTWNRPTITLGSNPRILSASGTVDLNAPLLGDDGSHPATGIWVKPGVTATLVPTSSLTVILLDGPIVVEGTLDVGREAAGSPNAAGLFANATVFALAPTGQLLARGEAGGPSQAGGAGGAVSVAVQEGVFLFGSVDASGGPGGAGGGDGGLVVMGFSSAFTDLGGAAVQAGPVNVSGGESDAPGRGGTFSFGVPAVGVPIPGGELRAARSAPGAARAARPIVPDDVFTFSSGEVLARGGAGGGEGGLIEVSGGAATVVTGTLDASGGSVVSTSSLGGAGGVLAVGVWGGPIWCEGTLSAVGGDSGGALAGSGGLVVVGPGVFDFVADPLATPDVHLSAVIDASGGAGADGSRGGEIVIHGDNARIVASEVDAGGSDGTGTGAGGSGGQLYLEASNGDGGTGTAVVAVPLVASAGGSDGGMGGNGGTVQVVATDITLGEASADGGNSSAEFLGGSGGAISIGGSDSTSAVAGPLAVRPGGGSDPGTDGTVTVDGAAMTLVDGVWMP